MNYLYGRYEYDNERSKCVCVLLFIFANDFFIYLIWFWLIGGRLTRNNTTNSPICSGLLWLIERFYDQHLFIRGESGGVASCDRSCRGRRWMIKNYNLKQVEGVSWLIIFLLLFFFYEEDGWVDWWEEFRRLALLLTAESQ